MRTSYPILGIIALLEGSRVSIRLHADKLSNRIFPKRSDKIVKVSIRLHADKLSNPTMESSDDGLQVSIRLHADKLSNLTSCIDLIFNEE